jgi:hypothetical protein
MTETSSRPSRRLVLAGLLAAPLAACVGGEAPGPRIARFREIRVDTTPLAAKGVGGYAAHVGEVLGPALARAFAGRLAPGDKAAPILVVEVSLVRLAGHVGGPRFTSFGSGDTDDEMVGALMVVSPRGAMIDRRRHYASSDAGSAGQWYLPDFDEKRLRALAANYAAWAVKEYGG